MSNISRTITLQIAAALLGLSMSATVGCQQRPRLPAEEERQAPSPRASTSPQETLAHLPELELEALRPRKRQLFISVLEDQFDPCGRPMSFGEALRSKTVHDDCPKAIELAQFVRAQVLEGKDRRPIVLALLEETRRRHRQVTLRLTGRPRHGPQDADALLVQFTNYACGYCRELQPNLERLLEAHPSVALVVKHCPLDSAEIATTAAAMVLAAERVGKGFDLHRALTNHEAPLDRATLEDLVREVGLDPEVLEAGLQDLEIRERLIEDIEDVERAMLEGIPSFWLDGREIPFVQLEAALSRTPTLRARER